MLLFGIIKCIFVRRTGRNRDMSGNVTGESEKIRQ